MGVSTNAILFYGYCWTKETSRPWEIGSDGDAADTDDGWEERYARAKGCVPPRDKFPDRVAADGYSTPTDYSGAEQAIIDQHETYWGEQRKIVEAATCCIDTHCSGECPMPYVAVKVSRTIARRGYMKEITLLAVNPTWDEALAEFCASMGIKTAGLKAAWWLVSDWN
jgi:hypothetical protein